METQSQPAVPALGRTILVLSGKGGVGKSTIAVNLALTLARLGRRVGLLDADLHGPSVPTLLNLHGRVPGMRHGRILPVEVGALKVMSVGLMLEDRQAPVIWRGPMKAGALQQMVRDADWGELDEFVVDCPPGTGDEPLSAIQLLAPAYGAVIVTTPQEVALADVRRSVNFCRQLAVPILGVVENMSGFVCPHCGQTTDIFTSGGAERMAVDMGIPFLGRVPLDPGLVACGDAGAAFLERHPETPAARALAAIVRAMLHAE